MRGRSASIPLPSGPKPGSVRAGLAVMLVFAAAALFHPPPALADEGDSARIVTPSLFLGQQTTLIIEVATSASATVELDPAAASWNGIEVVRLGKTTVRPAGGGVIQRMEIVVAPFQLGTRPFAPAVTVIDGGVVTPRQLPAVALRVASTLGENPKLQLTPLPVPRGITGAESPLLKPAIALGGLAAAAGVFALVYFGGGWLRRRPVRTPSTSPEPAYAAEVGVTEDEIDADPVTAYRSLAATVRASIARKYGLPAQALTTMELRRRMAEGGFDRFQGKLVGNLLDECDAVVYAGYRPATARRRADLTMAREIVEGAG